MNWTQALDDYIHYLRFTRRAGGKTVFAYLHDLKLFSSWMDTHGIADPLIVQIEQIDGFMEDFSAFHSNASILQDLGRVLINQVAQHRFADDFSPFLLAACEVLRCATSLVGAQDELQETFYLLE